MKHCVNCEYYYTEYNGKNTDFINACLKFNTLVSWEDEPCIHWQHAPESEMEKRRSVWKYWASTLGWESAYRR